ncbi:MAG: zf-TFIIB domain-containing protein [Candidatus Sericytochromatia bacterium]|nr:zf-TFIIB domain-containing protein [Candidatus Sericytochromatia bacterium]
MQKPSDNEEAWFREEERRKRQDEVAAAEHRFAVEQREALKALHWMHCPKCGSALREREYEGIRVDECVGCHGTWLDPGELKQLAPEATGGFFAWLKRIRGNTGPLVMPPGQR